MAACAPTKIIPGPRGTDGAPGAAGSNGVDAFTLLTGAATQPAIGATVNLAVGSSGWAAVGQPIFVTFLGVLYVTAIPDATHITAQNPAAETGNSPAGTIAPIATKVAPAGFKGPQGASGVAGGGVTVGVKGDLQTYSGAPANLAVGTNGERPKADSTAGTGLSYSKVDLASAAEVTGVLPSANGGNADRLPLAGGTLTGQLRESYAAPKLWLKDTGGAANEKNWYLQATGSQLNIVSDTDAEGAPSIALSILRTAGVADEISTTNVLLTVGLIRVASYLSLVGSLNDVLVAGDNDNIDFGTSGYIKLKPGPAGGFALTGIANGEDGRVLILQNATGQVGTLKDENAGSTVSNRIVTGSGLDVVFKRALLIYDLDAARWALISYS